MPAKKKGGARKRSLKKGRRASKLRALAEKEEFFVKCRRFLRIYPLNCAPTDSLPSPKIISSCKEALENEKILTKFVLESVPGLPSPPQATANKKGQKMTKKKLSTAKDAAGIPSTRASLSQPPKLLIQPLFKSLVESEYNFIRCLHVWGLEITDDIAVTLALFLESPLGHNIKVLELRSTALTSWGVERLAKPLARLQISTLNMDYNHLEPVTLSKLCERLQQNNFLQTLSLNFCNLDKTCGEALGTLGAISQIRTMSLIGNHLMCQGCTEMMRPLVSLCESGDHNSIKLDSFLKVEGPKKQEEPKEVPDSKEMLLPVLSKLDLRDNSIDSLGICNENTGDNLQTFEPVICMRAVKRWILSSPILEELNLDHNLIGDGGARELLQGIMMRMEMGLPVVKVVVTARISPDTFQKIVELTKTKKGGKKKKKKKK